MRITWTVMAFALMLAGLSLAAPDKARADDFNPNSVSVGYADGYMGADHQFHVWEHRSDAEGFRAKHGDLYRPWRHDDPRHSEAEK